MISFFAIKFNTVADRLVFTYLFILRFFVASNNDSSRKRTKSNGWFHGWKYTQISFQTLTTLLCANDNSEATSREWRYLICICYAHVLVRTNREFMNTNWIEHREINIQTTAWMCACLCLRMLCMYANVYKITICFHSYKKHSYTHTHTQQSVKWWRLYK